MKFTKWDLPFRSGDTMLTGMALIDTPRTGSIGWTIVNPDTVSFGDV
jgi:hypothetical protein